jgi:hypothetical protein
LFLREKYVFYFSVINLQLIYRFRERRKQKTDPLLKYSRELFLKSSQNLMLRSIRSTSVSGWRSFNFFASDCPVPR